MKEVGVTIGRFDAALHHRDALMADVLELQQQLLYSPARPTPSDGFLISAFSPPELAALLDAPGTALYFAYRQTLLLGFCLVTARHEFDDLCSDPGRGTFQGDSALPSGPCTTFTRSPRAPIAHAAALPRCCWMRPGTITRTDCWRMSSC